MHKGASTYMSRVFAALWVILVNFLERCNQCNFTMRAGLLTYEIVCGLVFVLIFVALLELMEITIPKVDYIC